MPMQLTIIKFEKPWVKSPIIIAARKYIMQITFLNSNKIIQKMGDSCQVKKKEQKTAFETRYNTFKDVVQPI